MIQSFINDFFQPRTGLLSFGFLLAIFYASNAMMGMINTFDKSIREHKGFFLQKRLKAIQLTFILTLLVIVSGFVLVAQEAVIKWLLGLQSSKSISWWPYVRWTMLILIIFLSIALIYRFGPSVKKKWKLASPGALLSTSLILLTTLAFSYWVNNFGTYNTLYGSVGTILVLMLIIYFNAMIILIGFELNVSITYLLAESEKRKLKSMDGLDN
jgi:membrane protein